MEPKIAPSSQPLTRHTHSSAADRITPARHPDYRADIDGLRALAVLLVVGFHAFPTVFSGGFIGVDLFFVISGFLITGIIFENMAGGSFRFRDFYARRIQRIFPALLLVMFSCLIFGWFGMLAGEYKQFGKHLAGGAGFISNFVFWQESGYFDSAADTKPLLHLWSLGIEEQFYLAWPLILWAAYRLRANRLLVCVAIFAMAFLLNVASVHGNPVATFYSPATRIWELLAGSLLAHRAAAWHVRGTGTGQSGNWRAWLGLAMIGIAAAMLSPARAFPGWWALLPVAGATLIVAAGPRAWFNRVILSHPALVWVGLISYPLYLWHWPLLVFARLAEYNRTPPWPIRLAAVLLAALLAWLTYTLLEKRLRHARRTRATVTTLCALMLVAGLAGYGIYRSGGLPDRNANAKVALFADILSPPETRITNASCQHLLGRAPLPGVLCLANSQHPALLVMGDSHAMALNSAAYMGKAPLNTVLVAGHGCLPFVSYQNYGPQDNRGAKKCYQVTEEAIATARDVASVNTVVLVSRGPLYFSGKGFGIEETDVRFQGWTVEPLVAPAAPMSSQQAFVNGYVEVSRRLVALGKKVVLMIDVPEFSIHPEYCIANRPLGFRNQTLPTCVLSRTVVDARQREYRALVAQIQAQVPQLTVFDPIGVFCDSANCASKDASHVYFYDNNHVNLSGSSKLLGALAAKLATP